MRYDRYPLSHPKLKLLNPTTFNPEWFGVIKCKILPPRNLFLPVLPIKLKVASTVSSTSYEKLVFPLCKKCCLLGPSNSNQGVCKHDNDERALTSTWSTEEVKLSLEKGYTVLKIFEVWDFDSTTSLFELYIDNFMRLKLQSSPHTKNTTNEEYAAEIKSKMGIDLDLLKINPNAVLRTIAKLCMNSVCVTSLTIIFSFLTYILIYLFVFV
jgi:hypothetical protein